MNKKIVTLLFSMALCITACGVQKNVEPEQDTALINISLEDSSEDPTEVNNADYHFLEYLKGNETNSDGDKFWAVGESDIEYALYDMNEDGVNELLVRAYGYWIHDIIVYKDNKICSANVENLGSSGTTFINDKNQFVSGDTGHQGRNMYVVSELNDLLNAEIVLALVNYYDDWARSGSPEFYKKEKPSQDYLENIENFDTITEEDYNSLINEFSQENKNIKWMQLDTIDG